MTREEAIQRAEAYAVRAYEEDHPDYPDNATMLAHISLAFSALAHHLPPQVIQL